MLIVAVAVFESTEPKGLLTRTQKFVEVCSGSEVNVFKVALKIGVIVIPLAPEYH